MKTVLACVGGVVGLLVLMWILAYNDILLSSKFLPWQESIRRKTFEQSKAFNQGMTQELDSMRLEYIKTKDIVIKAGLKDVMLHRVADYDINKLPDSLRQFIQDLQNGDVK